MATTVEQEISRHLADEARVVLLNLAHDHRIGAHRKTELDKILPFFAARVAPLIPEPHEIPNRIQQVVRRYYRNRVAHSTTPDYSAPSLNAHNFVPVAKPGTPAGLHPETMLVHVIDLTKYVKAFQQAGFSGVPGTGATPHDVVTWLARNVPRFPALTVPGRSSAEVDDFVDRLLSMIFDYDRATRQPPTWVALWERFKTHLANGPNAWLQVLGMADSYRGGPRYPLVLVYELSSTGTLIRPTQLDAEFNSFHFPSPLTAPLTEGGFAMDRCPVPGFREPLSEFIHEPRRPSASDWVRGGSLAGPTSPMPGSTLALVGARRRHYERLKLKYPATSIDWMRDFTSLA
jgi:hypothetical protein